jgi:hypothetical protein
LPAKPSTRTTTIWKTNIATVSLSIIESAEVSFGSAVPLLIPDLVSLPDTNDSNSKEGVTQHLFCQLSAKQKFRNIFFGVV